MPRKEDSAEYHHVALNSSPKTHHIAMNSSPKARHIGVDGNQKPSVSNAENAPTRTMLQAPSKPPTQKVTYS